MKLYSFDSGSTKDWVAYDVRQQEPIKIDHLKQIMEAWTFLKENWKGGEIDIYDTLLELWLAPIPAMKNRYFIMFRVNPYGEGYLVSPVELPWVLANGAKEVL
jgi:hypothetical protein